MFSAAQAGTGDLAARYTSNITVPGVPWERRGKGRECGGGRTGILLSHPVVDFFPDIITVC